MWCLRLSRVHSLLGRTSPPTVVRGSAGTEWAPPPGSCCSQRPRHTPAPRLAPVGAPDQGLDPEAVEGR